MMHEQFCGKASRSPALHARGDNCYRILAAGTKGEITSDALEASPSEDLKATRHMMLVDELMVINQPRVLRESGSHNSEMRILSESFQEKDHVVHFESDVRIQVANDLEVQRSQPLVGCRDAMDLGGELVIRVFRQA
jgi:hypothetical protein